MNNLFLVSAMLILACSCKKKKETQATQNNFLKATWKYSNGAEAYYDGISTYAQGTKVPNNNSGFNFIVGENYWQNLNVSGANTWTLNHILRSSNGTKTYNMATFTKVNDSTLKADINSFGTEYLIKK